ncbi:helix-turn-helix transcriptional regulator [Methanohalophilus portucalensis]|uniref:Predicted transcriptional regulator, contains HTH domain n=2 Tax=Methanohalophilus portucalensis TaxID=39664 RepID=A0A1L9C1I6_9EURY|nr:winged helix-turn-helix domain-containing protein [Methanohalophilus portucalensis]ATU08817.1 hypothetical protein BKM01_08575 [Methanohalophilus portucalensis]OJH48380.1 hypothetical protein MPF_2106 [Methanohalophilus portucalensis FDF-1]RNI12179.1 winged helix-turn-helix domain-containing protein [Methanohalophilus portucalensis FDF-1]SMH42877.1 Predicted transcriptional regulator, contains HTH domain [Methanohalophilus portucalensis FDF-1]
MAPQELIDTIFLSDKRERFLLLLLEGPTDIKKVKDHLNVTSSSILPQIKKLREKGLVSKDDEGIYDLTTTGRLIVENLLPLACLLDVFDSKEYYWETRDMDVIPRHLVENIGQLGEVEVIEPDLDHMYDLQPQLHSNMLQSNYIKCLISFFHPDHVEFFNYLSSAGKNLELLFTASVMERILAESPSDMQKLIEQENVDIRLFRENDYIPSLTIGDDFTYFCFFNKSHMYDHRDIISFTEGSIEWGAQLFVYYRDLSVPVSSDMLSEIINGSD